MTKVKRNGLVLFITALLLLSFTGCTGNDASGKEINTSTTVKQTQDTKPDTSQTTKEAAGTQEGTDKNYLSAGEAVEIAYEEAMKWSDDALFRRITNGSELSVHYNWPDTEMAYHWSVNFVSPAKKQYMIVYVNYGDVQSTLIKDDDLKNMPVDGHPKDRLFLSLKEAYETAVDKGAVYGLMPVNILYSTYGYLDHDFPYWMFVFRVPLENGEEEIHYYYVNAKTGQVSDVYYKGSDGKETVKEALKVKDQDLSALFDITDQRYTVIKFFTLINEGKIDMAVDMMDDDMLADTGAKKMWTNSLSSISGCIYVSGGFLTEDEKNWTEDTQRFKIKLMIPDELDCEQYGWDHGEITRWMVLRKYKEGWKVHELSTSP